MKSSLALITGVLLFVPVLSAQEDEGRQDPVEAQTQKKPQLDMTRWWVDVTPVNTGKEGEPGEEGQASAPKAFYDVLVFTRNNVWMTACSKKGFTPSTFTLEQKDEKWHLDIVQTSPSAGKTTWKLVLDGDKIEGTMTLAHDDKSDSFTVKGEKGTALEGTVWQVEATPQKGEDDEPPQPVGDTISFEKGKIVSAYATNKGAKPASFSASEEEGVWTIEFTASTEEAGRGTWSLEIRAHALTGKMSWDNADGDTQLSCTLKGRMQPEMPAKPAR